MPFSPVWPFTFASLLNKFVIALAALKTVMPLLATEAGSSPQYCYKIPDDFE